MPMKSDRKRSQLGTFMASILAANSFRLSRAFFAVSRADKEGSGLAVVPFCWLCCVSFVVAGSVLPAGLSKRLLLRGCSPSASPDLLPFMVTDTRSAFGGWQMSSRAALYLRAYLRVCAKDVQRGLCSCGLSRLAAVTAYFT